MSIVRIYAATSVDGFIADSDGSVDWLEGFDPRAYGYDTFKAEVGSVVMGRRTFEHAMTFAEEWPYQGSPSFVIASQPIKRLPEDTVILKGGIDFAIETARRSAGGDVWIVGGAVTMLSALERGHVDLIEMLLVPVLLGRGLSLFGPIQDRAEVTLDGIQTYSNGVVKLAYRPLKRI